MQTTYAKNAYTHVMITTSDIPLDLVIMLYDGAINYLRKVIFYINQSNTSKKIYYISKVMAIIEELLISLDMNAGGDIALNLRDLYIYILKELTIANAKNDIARVKHIESLLIELIAAWRKIK